MAPVLTPSPVKAKFDMQEDIHGVCLNDIFHWEWFLWWHYLVMHKVKCGCTLHNYKLSSI